MKNKFKPWTKRINKQMAAKKKPKFSKEKVYSQTDLESVIKWKVGRERRIKPNNPHIDISVSKQYLTAVSFLDLIVFLLV